MSQDLDVSHEHTSPPVRLGVLGCADVARRRVLPAALATPGIRLTAVASRVLGRAVAMAQLFGGEPLPSYQRLLERADVDAVYIPVPSALRADWITRALLAGKHVLAEKPLTTSSADTERVLALARRQGLVLRENFMFPAHSQHATVRRMLADGLIGTVRTFTSTFAIPARPQGDIRYRADLGGGALLDVGGYPVRAAQLFLGSSLRVLGAQLWHDDDLGVDLGGAALLNDDDGVSIQLSFGLAHAYRSFYQFHGSTGRLTLEHVFTPPASHRPVLELMRQDHREQLTLAADDQFARSMKSFVDEVRDAPSDAPRVSLAQARIVDEIWARADEKGGSPT